MLFMFGIILYCLSLDRHSLDGLYCCSVYNFFFSLYHISLHHFFLFYLFQFQLYSINKNKIDNHWQSQMQTKRTMRRKNWFLRLLRFIFIPLHSIRLGLRYALANRYTTATFPTHQQQQNENKKNTSINMLIWKEYRQGHFLNWNECNSFKSIDVIRKFTFCSNVTKKREKKIYSAIFIKLNGGEINTNDYDTEKPPVIRFIRTYCLLQINKKKYNRTNKRITKVIVEAYASFVSCQIWHVGSLMLAIS